MYGWRDRVRVYVFGVFLLNNLLVFTLWVYAHYNIRSHLEGGSDLLPVYNLLDFAISNIIA